MALCTTLKYVGLAKVLQRLLSPLHEISLPYWRRTICRLLWRCNSDMWSVLLDRHMWAHESPKTSAILWANCTTMYQPSERNYHHLIQSFWIMNVVTFQTKYFTNTKRTVVGTSNTRSSSSNHLQMDLGTSVRTKHCSEHSANTLNCL